MASTYKELLAARSGERTPSSSGSQAEPVSKKKSSYSEMLAARKAPKTKPLESPKAPDPLKEFSSALTTATGVNPDKPVLPERRLTPTENKQAAVKRLKETPLETVSALRNTASDLNNIWSDFKNYITASPEGRTTTDVVAGDMAEGLKVAGRTVKTVAKAPLNVLKAWTKTFADASGELLKDEIPTEKARAINSVAQVLDQTVGETGTVLKQSYDRFSKINPNAKDMVLGVLSGTTAAVNALSSEVSDVALPALAENQGAAGSLARGVIGGIEKLHGGLKYGLKQVLSLDKRNTEAEVEEAANSIATIMTMGLMVKGGGKVHEIGTRAFRNTVEKMGTARASVPKGTDPQQAVSRAIQDAALETIAEDSPGTVVTPQAREAYTTPLDQGGRNKIKALTPKERFAFESETAGDIADGINDISKKAIEDGIEVELSSMREQARAEGIKFGTEDIPFNDYPATFDPTSGSIIFNYAKIREHLETLAKGDSIIYGRGAQQYVAKRNPGESFADVSKRYLNELYEHELAHAKTVSERDILDLRDAETRGDKETVKKIVKDLEERAHRFVQVKQSKILGEDVTQAKADILRSYEDVRMAKENLEQLKFNDPNSEDGYQLWKRYASKLEGRENHTADQVARDIQRSNKNKYKTESEVFRKLNLERPLEDASEIALRPDDILETYQKRFRKEKEIKETFAKNKEAQAKDKKQQALPESKKDAAGLRESLKEARLEMRGREKELKRAGKKEGDIRVLLERGVEISRRKFTEQKLKEKFNNKLEAQKVLAAYLREIKMPREERGRHISDILNSSPDTLVKKLAKIDRDYSAYEQKQARKKVLEAIKKKVKMKIETRTAAGTRTSVRDARSVEMLREIKRNLKNGSRAEAFAERQRLIEEFREKNPQGDIPESLQDRLDVLSTYDIKNQSVSQLERTLEIIESLRENGKIKRAKEVELLKNDIEKTRSQVIETSEITPTSQLSKPQKDAVRFAMDGIKKFLIKSKSPEFLADYISQKGEAFRSAISNFIREGALRKDAAQRLTKADDEQFGRELLRSYGYPETRAGRKGLEKELGEIMLKEVNLGRFSNSAWKEKDLILTRGRAIDIISQAKNAATREILMNENNKFTPEVLDKIESILTEGDKNVIQALYAAYAKKFPLLNETSAKDTGVFIGYIADNYIPRISKGEGMNPSVQDEFLKRGGEDPYSVRHASIKQRLGTHGTIEFMDNPFAKYKQYASRVNYYASMWDYAKMLDGVFDSKVLKGLEEKYGEGVRTGIEKYKNDIKRGGLERLGDGYNNVMKLRNNIARALLNSPTVVAGQFSSTLQFAMEARSIGDYTKGMVEFMRSPLELGRSALEKSIVLQTRYDKKTFLEEATNLSQKASIRDVAGTSSFLDKLDLPLEKADMVTTISGWHTVYSSWKREFKQRGFDDVKAENLAVREADASVLRTQSSTDWMGKSQYESSELGRALISFSNQPVKMLNVMQHAVINARRGKMSKAQAAKILFTYSTLIPALYATLQTVTKRGVAAAFGQEDEQDLGKNIINAMISSPMGGLPLVGGVAQFVLGKAQGKNYDYAPFILTQPVNVLGSAFAEASQGDLDEATVELAKMSAMLLGVGYVQSPASAVKKNLGEANKEERAEYRKTPEGRAEAREKKIQKKLDKQK